MRYDHGRNNYLRFALLLISLAGVLAGSLAAGQAGTNAATPDDQRLTPETSARQTVADRPGAARAAEPGADAREQIRIGSGDLLEVNVYGTDFSKVVRVSPNGNAVLPLIGEIRVAGLTPRQAEAAIRNQLMDREYFNDPEVSVFVKEYATQGVSILGEVQKPGVYPLLGPRTLLDAISIAGGTTQRAGNSVSITHRDTPHDRTMIKLSTDPTKPTQSDVQIYPGDTIEVLRAPIVYVVGDVHMPGGFIVENGKRLTVLQAVAMAQGANATAALDSARIIRNTSQGRQDIPIALKKILAAKAPDAALQPDDIVFVPTSAGKSAARRGIEAALQAAVGVAIYRP